MGDVVKFVFVLGACLAVSLSGVQAITAEDIAKYMGLSSWETTVSLPSESFTVELYEISDGSVGKLIFQGMTDWSKDPEKGLRIVSGSEEGKYRFVVIYGSGVTLGADTDVPKLDQTTIPTLPKTVTAGDYVLFGMRKQSASPLPVEDVGSYSAGFLLRIAKRR